MVIFKCIRFQTYILFTFALTFMTLSSVKAHELVLQNTNHIGLFMSTERFNFSAKSTIIHDSILHKNEYQPIYVASNGSAMRLFIRPVFTSCGVKVDELFVSLKGGDYTKIGADGLLIPINIYGFYIGISSSVSPCKKENYQLVLNLKHEH